MKPRQYSSEGIVLSRKNYFEADRILVVFSKHYGKISLLAKGVRKPKSRKRGSLEIFSQIKFSAAKGKNLDLVTEVELIDSFSFIRKNLKKSSVAYYLVEVISRLTREDEKNVHLYLCVLKYLKLLKNTKSLRRLREKFIYETLVILGFWPKDRKMEDVDKILENIIEREVNSSRVGKRLLS